MLKTVSVMLMAVWYLLLSLVSVVSETTVSAKYQEPVKAYVHSESCQKDNYLQLDCWNKCNGDQFVHHQSKMPLPAKSVLTNLTLDFHQLPLCVTTGNPVLGTYNKQHATFFSQFIPGESYSEICPPPEFI